MIFKSIRKWFWRLGNVILIWIGLLGCLKNQEKIANLVFENSLIYKTSTGHNSVKNEYFEEIFFEAFLESSGAPTRTKQTPKSPKKAPL